MEKGESTRWMTLAQAATYLHCGERTLAEMMAKRQIPFTMFAGKGLFHPDRLDEWLLANETTPSLQGAGEGKAEVDKYRIQADCNRETVNALLSQLIDYGEHFVTTFGEQLKRELEASEYASLERGGYRRLSRWCHPRRQGAREKEVKPIAEELSRELYGLVIDRE